VFEEILELDESSSPAERAAAARSFLARAFAEAFGYPGQGLYDSIARGEFRALLANALKELPHRVRLEEGLALVPSDPTELESEYIRLFEVGSRGVPPCPLYGGHYRPGARMQVMEEVVRFYEHFGLALAEKDRELPDHLTVELEFLHYLAFREALAVARGLDPSPYRRAQRDFLERQLCRWLPAMRGRLQREGALPFYGALVRAVVEFAAEDLGYVNRLLGS
jgi:DMSO reductase family type II enzyme chaperone